ncbi:YjcZ family sporulation protein [Metabacillus litoralis]
MMMPYTYEAPAYGYCAPTYRPNNTFALIVVLFILLIIIGATIYGPNC